MTKEKTKQRKVIGIAQGVNLDLLGQREVDIYGGMTLASIEDCLRKDLKSLSAYLKVDGFSLEFFQSNSEVEFLEFLSNQFSALIINSGAWTHTSLAIADRLRATKVPYIEAHISNIAARESFRHHSFTAPHAQGVIFGLGLESYRAALYAIMLRLRFEA
jgi:3-dehydroquinate dehydratase-2